MFVTSKIEDLSGKLTKHNAQDQNTFSYVPIENTEYENLSFYSCNDAFLVKMGYSMRKNRPGNH